MMNEYNEEKRRRRSRRNWDEDEGIDRIGNTYNEEQGEGIDRINEEIGRGSTTVYIYIQESQLALLYREAPVPWSTDRFKVMAR